MSSMLTKILFRTEQRTPFRLSRGRRIVFDKTQPDISLITGTLLERIEEYLKLSGEPATVSEIAQGINSNASRVMANLQVMQRTGKVQAIKIEGCVTEYQLPRRS